MAVRFSDHERAGIVKALRKAAERRAALKGMRKTTVDELVEEAGISKGAFYKFYPSKEHLFLDMLEHWQQRISDQITAKLAAQPGLRAPQRAALMLKAAWRSMHAQSILIFANNELPYLLRKLPDALVKQHYQSNEEFIHRLMGQADIRLRVPEAEAYATIRILLFSLLAAKKVGSGYAAAMDALIDDACVRMIEDE